MKNDILGKNDTISFRTNTKLKQSLQRQAKQQNISLSNYIEGLLRMNFEHPCQKSQYRIYLIEIYNAIQQGNTVYALKLLEKELNKNGTK